MNGVFELGPVFLDWELLDQNHTLDNMNIPQKSKRNPRPAEYLDSVDTPAGYLPIITFFVLIDTRDPATRRGGLFRSVA